MNEHINKLPPKVILWGGTGQAKESRPIIEYYGAKVIAVFDDTPHLESPFSDVPIYHGWAQFKNWINSQIRAEIGFCIAIGNPHGRIRLRLQEELIKEGLLPVSIAHPSAVIADDAIIGVGCQIMAGAIIQSEVQVGKQCIINALAYLDHQTCLGDGSELAAGSKVMGLTKIGSNTLIGVNVVVLSRLRIGDNVRISAGSIVSSDIGNDNTIIGFALREQ